MSSRKKLPRIALVGRRNIGKSTMMNTLLGRNRAITEDLPGLTRDVLEVEIHRHGLHFLLSDTPGLDIEEVSELDRKILENARKHLGNMDLILHMMDAEGPTAFDFELLELFRRKSFATPVLFVVNKVDGAEGEQSALLPFFEAGFVNPLPVSAISRWNIQTLLREIEKVLPAVRHRGEGAKKEEHDSTVISDTIETELNISIIGRPNAGKSSLFNRLIAKELSIVSEVAGTTRDTIDSIVTYHGRPIRIIDTAGLRRRSRVEKERDAADFFSMRRTNRAITDSDVIIHLIDATVGITDLDKKIESTIQKAKKPVLIAVNKWDAVKDKDQNTMKEHLEKIHFFFPYSVHVPVLFISAVTGQRIGSLIETALELKQKSEERVATAKLNELVEKWNRGLRGSNQKAKIFYATQSGVRPPEFVLFVRDKKNIPVHVISYFENHIRTEFSLSGIPFQIHIREKSSENK